VKTAARRLSALWDSISDDIPVMLTVGLVLGTFPVYGVPTLLCVVAARALRLNPVALLALNQLATPVQLALFVPFVRAGLHVSVSASSPLLWRLAAVSLQAITGWCFVAVPAGILFHFALLHAARRAKSAQSLPAASTA
jgi:Uncharacterized protein conserved in bacteria (DUF2062)